jgi:hypothetical protein
MEWLATILAALKAIPVISQDLRDIATFFRKAQNEQWFDNLNQSIRTLQQPTTKEQKDEAAKAISDSITHL